jgi:hypothetical protein
MFVKSECPQLHTALGCKNIVYFVLTHKGLENITLYCFYVDIIVDIILFVGLLNALLTLLNCLARQPN